MIGLCEEKLIVAAHKNNELCKKQKIMADMLDENKVNELKAWKRNLEFHLTNDDILNYGSILKELNDIDKALYSDIKIYQESPENAKIELAKLKQFLEKETCNKFIPFSYRRQNIFKRFLNRIRNFFVRNKSKDLQ